MKILLSRVRLLAGMSLLVLSLCLFSACASGPATPTTGIDGTPDATSTPVTTPTSSPAVEPTPSNSIAPGVQPCPASVNNATYWSAVITLSTGSSIGRITCGHLIGKPSLQALIVVGYDGTGHIIDAYVFDQIDTTHPKQLFKLESLDHGDAKISPYSTVMTAEVDADSRINKGQPNAALQRDLYREFKWSDGAGTLVPVAFPGFYPDLTRWEAEEDQERVTTSGVDTWKNDALEVSKNFSSVLLSWSGATATFISGGGTDDLSAVVALKSGSTGAVIHTHLSRLEGKKANMWVITSVDTDNTPMTAPVALSLLKSPVDVTGSGNAFEGDVGEVVIYDHLYDKIATVKATVGDAEGTGHAKYSAHVAYTTSFKTGTQEGLVAHYHKSEKDGSIASVVIIKVLLG